MPGSCSGACRARWTRAASMPTRPAPGTPAWPPFPRACPDRLLTRIASGAVDQAAQLGRHAVRFPGGRRAGLALQARLQALCQLGAPVEAEAAEHTGQLVGVGAARVDAGGIGLLAGQLSRGALDRVDSL